MRKLASIQKVLKIEPIENADNIELATILGWHVVVKKGEFKAGDLAVYVETDSILPKNNPDFAFLEGKRLRTKKLRGVYSQGIAFPLSILPGWCKQEGTDVTSELGITKWEPDEYNRNQQTKQKKPRKWYMRFAIGRWFWKKFLYRPDSGPFPAWIYKTDETSIQVLQDILDKYSGMQCEYTEKVDGSPITVWYNHDEKKLHVCSCNKEIFDQDDRFFVTAMKYADKIKRLTPGMVLQGELLGPGIQGNKYELKECIILFYQASMGKEFLQPSLFRSVMKDAGLDTVPYLGSVRLGTDIDYFIDLAKGTSVLNRQTRREGIVIRPERNVYELNDNRFVGDRISFKAINPEFLVKYDL